MKFGVGNEVLTRHLGYRLHHHVLVLHVAEHPGNGSRVALVAAPDTILGLTLVVVLEPVR